MGKTVVSAPFGAGTPALAIAEPMLDDLVGSDRGVQHSIPLEAAVVKASGTAQPASQIDVQNQSGVGQCPHLGDRDDYGVGEIGDVLVVGLGPRKFHEV